MAIQEAIDLFKEDLKDGKCNEDCPECNARELAISALEKQIPKKPKDHPLSDGKCPCCNAVFDYDWKPKSKFCQNCGQALDWGDDNV